MPYTVPQGDPSSFSELVKFAANNPILAVVALVSVLFTVDKALHRLERLVTTVIPPIARVRKRGEDVDVITAAGVERVEFDPLAIEAALEADYEEEEDDVGGKAI